MILIQKDRYGAALERYRDGGEFFPLIAAVLLDAQDGVVYADDAVTPQQFYVEHSFGFAQIYGTSRASFEKALEAYLFVTRRFSAPKVRLYGVDPPRFLSKPQYDAFRSIRQRFRRSGAAPPLATDDRRVAGLDVIAVDDANVDETERTFGVVTRFWRGAPDFVRNANACVVTHEGDLASICYGTAVADGKAEIDVLTESANRRIGAGKVAVAAFIERCSALSVEAVWDCFTNNEASMGLEHAMGFPPSRDPYTFFTISR